MIGMYVARVDPSASTLDISDSTTVLSDISTRDGRCCLYAVIQTKSHATTEQDRKTTKLTMKKRTEQCT